MDRHEAAAKAIHARCLPLVDAADKLRLMAAILREHFPERGLTEKQVEELGHAITTAMQEEKQLLMSPTWAPMVIANWLHERDLEAPERGHGERLKDALLTWGADYVDYKVDEDLIEGLVDTMERQGFFAEPEPKGTCGECEWWLDRAYRCTKTDNDFAGGYSCMTRPDFYGCPRFQKREDKAARLAREFFNLGCDPAKRMVDVLAAHLRANGVGEE
jgi:hypothetical protein